MGHEPRVEGRDPDYWPDDASALADLRTMSDAVDAAKRELHAALGRSLTEFDHAEYTRLLGRFDRSLANLTAVREAVFKRALNRWRDDLPSPTPVYSRLTFARSFMQQHGWGIVGTMGLLESVSFDLVRADEEVARGVTEEDGKQMRAEQREARATIARR